MKLQFLLFVICAALLFTIDLPAQQTVVLQPGPEGKDALVNNIFPDITHGNYQNLVATAGTNGGRLDTNRSFIQFDLSAIPQDAEILDAKLSLYFAYDHNGEYSHYGQNQAYLQRITNPWEESEATWHNQPRTTPINQVILPKSESSTQDYEDIDVTLLVQDMFADPEHSFGFMIRMVTEEPYRRMFFASGDYEISDHHPKLVVTYSGCEPPTASYSYVKENRLVNFTDQSSPALSWLWDFGDGYGSYLQNPAHEYSEAGTYITCLTVIDSCSEDTFCDTIDNCNLPSAEFSWSANLLNVQFHDSSEYT